MRILRPEEIDLLRMGRPVIPANGGDGGDSSSSSNTTSSNTTNTITQDRRLVVDNGGTGVTADNSIVNISTTDHGALQAASELAQVAANNQATVAYHALDTSAALSKTGYDMLKANTDLAAHLNDSSVGLLRQFSESSSRVAEQSLAQSQAALQVVSSVVTKPLDVSDPSHQLVLVGIAAVGIVAFASMKKG